MRGVLHLWSVVFGDGDRGLGRVIGSGKMNKSEESMFLRRNSVGKMNKSEESMLMGRNVLLKMDKSKLSIFQPENESRKYRNPHECG